MNSGTLLEYPSADAITPETMWTNSTIHLSESLPVPPFYKTGSNDVYLVWSNSSATQSETARPYHSFDQNNTSYWTLFNTSSLVISLPVRIALVNYTIVNSDFTASNSFDWALHGWDSNVLAWNLLDKRSMKSSLKNNSTKLSPFPLRGIYQTFRLSASNFTVNELRLSGVLLDKHEPEFSSRSSEADLRAAISAMYISTTSKNPATFSPTPTCSYTLGSISQHGTMRKITPPSPQTPTPASCASSSLFESTTPIISHSNSTPNPKQSEKLSPSSGIIIGVVGGAGKDSPILKIAYLL